ncbi:MAG: formate dehydrogenase accessory sulfurtransferase FdhD, partial [Planctomycetota bacterium]|nr:formate dehydrogenase accessory sulfurtransferase FdhD [Planctomycetota bacterium]
MESIPDGAARVQVDGDADDLLIREEPLWIECHGARLLTMRTPGRDRELVVGHLLDEGVIRNASEVAQTEEIEGEPSALRPDTIRITLKRPGDARIEGRLTRTHEIRPSCGICGLVDADTLLDDMLPLLTGTPRLSSADIEARRAAFDAEQPLFRATGASHAAVVFGPDGTIWGRG